METYNQICETTEESARAYFEQILLADGFVSPDVPAIIHEFNYVQTYGNPWEGGSYDQPHLTMEQLNIVTRVRQEVQRLAEVNRRIREKNG